MKNTNNNLKTSIKEYYNSIYREPESNFVSVLKRNIQNLLKNKSNNKNKLNSLIQNYLIYYVSRYKAYTPLLAILSILSIVMILIFIINTNKLYLPFTKIEDLKNNSIGQMILSGLDNIQLVPEKFNKEGIDTNSDFKIITKSKININKNIVNIKPYVKYDLQKIDDNEFKIDIQEPLKENTLYTISLNEKNTDEFIPTWSFKTSNNFKVDYTEPIDKSTNVPENIAVKIVFNTDNLPSNIEEYIETNPKIEGQYQLKGNTLYFYPSNNLKPNHSYAFKIKKELYNTASNKKLEKDYVFSFDVGKSENYVYFANPLYKFLPNSSQLNLELALDNLETHTNFNDSDIKINLYRLPNSLYEEIIKYPDFYNIKYSYNGSKLIYDRNKLEKIKFVNHKVDSIDNQYYKTKYLQLFTSLEEGFYLIDLVDKNNKEYSSTLININHISAVLVNAKNQSIIWAHDTNTGKPLEKAIVYINQKNIGTTNSEGVLTTNAIDSLENSFIKIESQNGKINYISQLETTDGGLKINQEYGNYISYMYMDKNTYRPNEKINLWGFVKNRDTNNIPEGIELNIYKEASLIERIHINPNNKGIFSLAINAPKVSGNYYLELKDKEDNIIKEIEYFKVSQTYSNPTYKIENLRLDKEVLLYQDVLKISGEVKLYSGEPASNINIKINLDNDTKVYKVKTNKDGKFSADLEIKPRDNIEIFASSKNYFAQLTNLYITVDEIESGESSNFVHIHILPKYIIETQNLDKNKFKLHVYKVNPSIKNNKAVSDDSEYIEGKASNLSLELLLKEVYYLEKEIGYDYNPIDGTKKKIYDYQRVENIINIGQITTDKNGEYELKYNFKDNATYTLYASYIDKNNRVNLVSYLNINIYDDLNTLSLDNNLIELHRNMDYAYKYNIGEEDTVQINSKKNLPNNSKYMFLILQNGIKNYLIKSEPILKVKMEEEDIPNFYVHAVVFTGKSYETSVFPLNFIFSENSKKAQIEVKTDKENYKPGDNVKIEITSKYNNKPIEMNFNISVIDRSHFDSVNYTQKDIEQKIKNELFKIISTGIKDIYISHKYGKEVASKDMGASGGMGGEVEFRQKFNDIAAFHSVSTNKDGKATIEFKLPDNITTWLIVAQGISNNSKYPEYGFFTKEIKSKLPLYILDNNVKFFVKGDKPILRFKVISDELPENHEVELIFNSQNLGVNNLKVKTKVNEYVKLHLSLNNSGNYKLKVEAKSGDKSDIIEVNLNVIDSRIETFRFEQKEINTNSEIILNSNNVELIISDKNSIDVYSQILNLYNPNNQRLDTKLASQIARKILNKYYSQDYQIDFIDASAYLFRNNFQDKQLSDQTYQIYGYSALPYLNNDLSLNLYLMILLSNFELNTNLSIEELHNFLQQEYLINEEIIKNNEDIPENYYEKKAVLLYGLSFVNTNYFNDVKKLLDNKEISNKAKLYLALALSNYNDKVEALKLIKNILENKTSFDINESILLSKYLLDFEYVEESINLYKNIKNNENTESSLLKLIYLNKLLEKSSNSNKTTKTIKYEIDNNNEELKLNNGFGIIRLIGKEGKTIRFKDFEGHLRLNIKTYNYHKETNTTNNNELKSKINRKFYVNDKEVNDNIVRVKLTDNVKIKLNSNYYQNPENNEAKDYYLCLQTNVPITSGLKSLNALDNVIKFCGNSYYNKEDIFYKMNVAAEGEFVIEPLIIYTQEDPFIIKDKYEKIIITE